MNNVDKQYLDLLRDILENGTIKQTRAGKVKSVFGRQMRFSLKDGLPLLTTKKVFTRGIIHELLWFLRGETNMKYLFDNNVHIWDDDAYRYYLELLKKHNDICDIRDSLNDEELAVYFPFDKYEDFDGLTSDILSYALSLEKLNAIDKETFLENVKDGKKIPIFTYVEEYSDGTSSLEITPYCFGDLGKIYGHQWRNQGLTHIDQIKNIIDTLKTNPDDRRMICMAWNASDFDEMGLPPCHYGFQVYTRELTEEERWDVFREKFLKPEDEEGYFNLMTTRDTQYAKGSLIPYLDRKGVPTRELSLMWMQRSVDSFLGLPFNIASYSILLSILAQCVNMEVGDVVCSLGDCHLYENHFNAAKEQLERDSQKYELPKILLTPNLLDIDEFKFDDIKIINYESYPAIKAPLSVGL